MRLAAFAALLASVAGLAASGAWAWRSGRADRAVASLETAAANAGATVGFRLESVAVEGRERESRAAILDALGVQRGMPLLAVDIGAAKARVEALPWVREADIERLLPDRLFIRLHERHPLAFWQQHERLALIADDGSVIRGAKLDQFGSLVVLVGDDAPKLGAAFLAMLATEPSLKPHVVAAVRVGGRRWTVKLDSGIEIALPEEDAESAWHKLAALERSDRLLDRDIKAVDLRLPDRLVVRLSEAPKPAPRKRKAGGRPT
ncbi:MAG: cell division protein FtsQ/DivIB [Stellaceae bacterium]